MAITGSILETLDHLVLRPKTISKFGRNPDVANNATEKVWPYGGSSGFNFATANETLFAVSDDATDTMIVTVYEPLKENAAGDWIPQPDATVTLNGLTPVQITADTYIRTSRARAMEDNAGTIFILTSTDVTAGVPDTVTEVRAVIGPLRIQTEMAMWTVPSGFGNFWFHSWEAGINNVANAGGARETNFDLCLREFGDSGFRISDPHPAVKDGTSAFHKRFELPFPDDRGLPPKTDLFAQADVTGGDTDVMAKFALANWPSNFRNHTEWHHAMTR